MSKTLNARMAQKNDTAANWTSANPILLKGELGIESDTKKIKIGDGVTAWSSLTYANVTTLADLGITSTAAELNALDGITATVTELNYTDGVTSAIQTQIDNKVTKNANITAGTGTKITYDAKGLVTGGASLAATDIPTLTLAKISDAGTAASKNTGTASGNVPVLDGTGKLSTSVLPALAISDTFVVATEAAMLAVTAEVGDIAVRTDLNKSFILKAAGASTLANWQELLTPTDTVTSVNSKTGAVTLTTSDIGEGTNLYYTDARVTMKIGNTASTSLSDGANICKTTDTFIIDCGNATL